MISPDSLTNTNESLLSQQILSCSNLDLSFKQGRNISRSSLPSLIIVLLDLSQLRREEGSAINLDGKFLTEDLLRDNLVFFPLLSNQSLSPFSNQFLSLSLLEQISFSLPSRTNFFLPLPSRTNRFSNLSLLVCHPSSCLTCLLVCVNVCAEHQGTFLKTNSLTSRIHSRETGLVFSSQVPSFRYQVSGKFQKLFASFLVTFPRKLKHIRPREESQ